MFESPTRAAADRCDITFILTGIMCRFSMFYMLSLAVKSSVMCCSQLCVVFSVFSGVVLLLCA